MNQYTKDHRWIASIHTEATADAVARIAQNPNAGRRWTLIRSIVLARAVQLVTSIEVPTVTLSPQALERLRDVQAAMTALQVELNRPIGYQVDKTPSV